jgi:hypothetical protein
MELFLVIAGIVGFMVLIIVGISVQDFVDSETKPPKRWMKVD